MKTKKCYETHTKCNKNYCERENKTMSQHTLTPWENNNGLILGKEPGRTLIAETHNGWQNDMSEKEELANAEFIVRACNAHEDLVDTMRACKAWFKMYRPEDRMIEKISDALEKAGVKV